MVMDLVTRYVRPVYDWTRQRVSSPYALLWLVGLMALESFIFPIPIDPLLILFCIEKPKKSFHYATLCTLSSVFGGALGYAIGSFLWDTFGSFFTRYIVSALTFESIRLKYELYETWAVLIAGFTPIPYKAVTLSAGFCKLSFLPFLFYSTLARGARFFLLAGIITVWGAQIKKYIDLYFDRLVLLFTVLVCASLWLIV